MPRTLKLDQPIVFEPSASVLTRRIAMLAVLPAPALFVYLAITHLSGAMLFGALAVIILLSIGFFVFALDGIETKVVVDAEGVELRTPFRKKRLVWNDGLQVQSRFIGVRESRTRVYDVTSPDARITFAENLENIPYLLSLIDAGINGRADQHSAVTPPPRPLATVSHGGGMAMLGLFGLFALVAAFIIGALAYEEAQVMFWTPTVPVRDAGKYAGKDTDIRVEGQLHAEPPVVSRDGRSFGFQFVELDSPRGMFLTIVSPAELELIDGKDKLRVKTVHITPVHFADPRVTTFSENWQQSDVGKLVGTNFDDDLQPYDAKKANGDFKLQLWTIEQDKRVAVVGRVRSEDGALFMQPPEHSFLWLTPSPDKQLEQSFITKAILLGAIGALGLLLLVAAWLEAKRALDSGSIRM